MPADARGNSLGSVPIATSPSQSDSKPNNSTKSSVTSSLRGSWPILAAATVGATLTGPGQTIGVSVFIDHFVEDLSLTRSQVAGAYLVGTLAASTILPSVGRYIDRRGVRRAQIIVGLMFGLALFNISLATGLIWLTIGFAGIRLFGQGSLSLISSVTVSLEFVRNRGTAIGVYSTVSSALMALVPVASAVAIDRWGWRVAWRILAVVVPAIVVPLAVVVYRRLPKGTPNSTPRDLATAGQDSDALATDDILSDEILSADKLVHSVDRHTALRSKSFWVLASLTGSSSMLATALNFHQIDLLGEVGMSSGEAAVMFLPQVLGSAVAGVTTGLISDRIGTRYLPAAAMTMLVLAHLLAAIASPGLIVISYAITLGAMSGSSRTIISTLLPSWFGTGHLGSIQGSLTFVAVACSAIGPVLLAQLEGAFGSYQPALLIVAGIPAVVAVFSLQGRSLVAGQQ